MLLSLYRLVTALSGPAIRAFLRRRKHRGKEDPRRMGERFGIPSRARPPGQLVWVHAASVGEAQSMLALIRRLRAERPGLHILVTTGTVASARLLENRLPHGAFHQYVPVDRVAWVRRFLNHWKPDLVLWVESELWPNLVIETRATDAPMVLVNGRISPRSYENWRRAPALARRLLGAFAHAFAQYAREGGRVRALGAPRVVAHGNLKYAADPLPADEAAITSFKAAIGKRPAWLAASTHAGEERAMAEVHKALAKRFPDLLTVIVPRHPSRATALTVELAPLRLLRRTLGPLPRRDTAIWATPWASSACSTGRFLSSSWADRWCPMAGRTWSSPRATARRSSMARTCTTSPRSWRRWAMQSKRCATRRR
jgi:3-deoxy-D-manno-octulosonic-acid transferase